MLADVRADDPLAAEGGVVGMIPNHDGTAVQSIAAALRAAQPEWEDLGPAGRARVLLAWGDWLLDNERRIAELVQRESGKAWADASMEGAVAVQVIRYYARHGGEMLGPRRVRPHTVVNATKRLEVRHRPYQLVGVITPWNGPLGAPAIDITPALMAGAAVLSKPSEVAPLAWAEAVRAWREDVGAPPVLDVALGSGATGAAVVDEVDMVMFTGSTSTGRKIAPRAGERLHPHSCGLELGGNDAMVVLGDADLDRAAAAATWGAMVNAGQYCISVERIYVEASVHDAFVAKLTEKVGSLRVGTDAPGRFRFTCDVGAMATQAQAEVVERHVVDALSRGAKATTGGGRRVLRRAHGPGRRRPGHGLHAGGDVRSARVGDGRVGRRGGDRPRERLLLRALCERLEPRRCARTAGGCTLDKAVAGLKSTNADVEAVRGGRVAEGRAAGGGRRDDRALRQGAHPGQQRRRDRRRRLRASTDGVELDHRRQPDGGDLGDRDLRPLIEAQGEGGQIVRTASIAGLISGTARPTTSPSTAWSRCPRACAASSRRGGSAFRCCAPASSAPTLSIRSQPAGPVRGCAAGPAP